MIALSIVALAGCAQPGPVATDRPAGLVVPSVPRSQPGGTAAARARPRPAHAVGQAIVTSVEVLAAPGTGAVTHRLAHPQPSGAPLVFLIQEEREDWLRVLLPVRPNGSAGWIRRSDVELSRHDFAIRVELGAHRITVIKANQVVLSEPIGVGKGSTPTPGGLYYTKELIEPVDAQGRTFPGGPYGPFAYGLSGFSDVLYDFAGGEGVIGIHGTNDPSSLGRDASAGCIRMSNTGITALAEMLPLGVPVEIVA